MKVQKIESDVKPIGHLNTKKKVDSDSDSQKFERLVFPNSIATYKDSFAYCKKLIISSISSITYLRAIFPEDHFVDRDFEGRLFHIIRPPTKDFQETTLINQWFVGAFDAMDKKYLRCLSLAIYENENEPGNVLETYDFEIKYVNNEASLQITKPTEQKKLAKKAKMNAVRMIRAINSITQSLNDLPIRIFMNMRLFYYENVTPIDFEPKGFEESNFEKYMYNTGKMRIDAGQLDSHFHQITLDINVDESMLKEVSDFQTIDTTFEENDFADSADSGLKTMSNKENTNNYDSHEKRYRHVLDKSLLDKSSFNKSTVTDLNETSAHLGTLIDSMSIITKMSDEINISKSIEIMNSESESKIKCSCMLNNKEENDYLLKCSVCFNYQHAICYNLKFENEAEFNTLTGKYKHNCSLCCLRDSKLSRTDETHLGCSEEQIREICIWRRLLIWLIDINKLVTIDMIIEQFDIPNNLAAENFKQLKESKILFLKNKNKKTYRIDHAALKAFIESSFKSEIVDSKQNNNLNKSVAFDLPDMSQSSVSSTQKQEVPEQMVPSSTIPTAKPVKTNNKIQIKNFTDDDDTDYDENENEKNHTSKRRRKSSISKESYISMD